MTQLIFDIDRNHYRMGDFFAQEFPITLTESVECLVHSVLGHAQLTPNLNLRRAVRFIGERFLQPVKQLLLASSTILLFQKGQDLVKYCQRPTTLKNLVGG